MLRHHHLIYSNLMSPQIYSAMWVSCYSFSSRPATSAFYGSFISSAMDDCFIFICGHVDSALGLKKMVNIRPWEGHKLNHTFMLALTNLIAISTTTGFIQQLLKYG